MFARWFFPQVLLHNYEITRRRHNPNPCGGIILYNYHKSFLNKLILYAKPQKKEGHTSLLTLNVRLFRSTQHFSINVPYLKNPTPFLQLFSEGSNPTLRISQDSPGFLGLHVKRFFLFQHFTKKTSQKILHFSKKCEKGKILFGEVHENCFSPTPSSLLPGL